MTENMQKFLEALSADKALAEKAGKLEKEALIAFAAEQGFALSEADFAAPAGEVSDDELETVAGGGDCFCPIVGGGTAGSHSLGSYKACACVAAGYGEGYDGYLDCACPIGGSGIR